MPDVCTDQYETIVFQDPLFKLNVSPTKYSPPPSDSKILRKMFHEEIEIKLFLEGEAALMIGSETVFAKPGDIVIINPYEFHTTIDLNDRPACYHLFNIGLDFFTETNPGGLNLRQHLLGRHLRFHNLIRERDDIRQILYALARETEERKEYYREAAEGLLLQLFSLLLRSETDQSNSAPIQEEIIRCYETISPALFRIHTAYSGKITVDDLAAACGVSKYHFCRIFHQATGETAIRYLTRYRLNIADILLATTGRSIADIAWNCGFPDECYFSRCYKKANGIAPGTARAILSKK